MNKISIITSLYKSEKYIFDFYYSYLEILKKLQVDYEFIFVNDASPDLSHKKVEELITKDDKVILIDFSKNFGQYPAMFAGMEKASGTLIYTTDSDLEEPPENLAVMYDILQAEKDTDVVYGVVEARSGGLVRGFFGKIFFKVLTHLSDARIPENQAWQRLMRSDYVKSLLLHKEYESIVAGLMAITGYNQKSIIVQKKFKGTTSYSFRKRMLSAINGLTAFSSKPLVYIALFGFSISFLAFVFILYIVFCKLYILDFQAGWITLITSIWMVGGLLMLSIGILGIYISKIFNQTKNRPLYIIKKITSQN